MVKYIINIVLILFLIFSNALDDRLNDGIDAQLNGRIGLKFEPSEAYKDTLKCDCLPECTSMSYIVENSQSDWDWIKKYQFDRKSPSYNITK